MSPTTRGKRVLSMMMPSAGTASGSTSACCVMVPFSRRLPLMRPDGGRRKRQAGPRRLDVVLRAALVHLGRRVVVVLGRQRRLRLGVELGLAVVERGLEGQAHLHAGAVLRSLALGRLQLLGKLAAPG